MYYFQDANSGKVYAQTTKTILMHYQKTGNNNRVNINNLREVNQATHARYVDQLQINGWNVVIDKAYGKIHIGSHTFSISTFEAIKTLMQLNVPTTGIVGRKVILDDEITTSPAMFNKVLTAYNNAY